MTAPTFSLSITLNTPNMRSGDDVQRALALTGAEIANRFDGLTLPPYIGGPIRDSAGPKGREVGGFRMKTPEQIADDVMEANHFRSYQMATGEEVAAWLTAAVEADREQREVAFDALDHMLNAWGDFDGDVPAFIQAWADHFNEGREVPEWASA
jgi:hypothetical protein